MITTGQISSRDLCEVEMSDITIESRKLCVNKDVDVYHLLLGDYDDKTRYDTQDDVSTNDNEG